MFIPRNAITAPDGRSLRAVYVCRISTENQSELSLDDQRALLECWLRANYSGPFEAIVIQTQGSGERTDRPELQQLEELVRTRRVDLILCEDLGRIMRRFLAVVFCETCQDFGVRLIALNDAIDTFDTDWQMPSVLAAFRHERHNTDTSARIRRTFRNRFMQGGINQFVIAGYAKPPGAKFDTEIVKLPEAEPVYDRWFQILEDGGTYSDVADFLNEIEFPMGQFCRSDRWTCAMVARVTFNPILKGVRERNRKHSVRLNETGKRRTVKAPVEELLTRNCPHLAFIDPERYDRVIGMLRLRNARFARNGDGTGTDPRAGVSKKRTRWPGQHARCSVCGGLFVFGAHGQKHRLMCTRAREYSCWMSAGFAEEIASQKIVEAVWQEIEALPDFTAEVRADLAAELKEQNASGVEREKTLMARKREFDRWRGNIQSSLRQYGPSPLIEEELRRLAAEELAIQGEEAEVARLLNSTIDLPSIEDIKNDLRKHLDSVGGGSQEAARFLRRLLPVFEIFPYRLIDGGGIVLRASIEIDLAVGWDCGLVRSDTLRHRCLIDLFDPPQRERHRSEVVRMRQLGMTEREIAQQLRITVTACQRAAALQRLMDERQVTDPYQLVTDITELPGRLRRHLHPRFRQEGDDRKSA